jgi:DNA mismatch repair protein MutS
MAQAGFFVAAEAMAFRPYDYLFTRIQNNDNIYAGKSSFAVEMGEFKTIMKYAGSNGIVLGDELCSGTETLDATALVAAGITKLAERGASFIFATHLHYLSTSPHILRLKNVRMVHLSVSYDNTTKRLIYERKLRDGSGPASYGIEVCKAMNMDEDYMTLAQQIRGELQGQDSGVASASLYKTSAYNTDKLISKCEVCETTDATDTHHIKMQCSADSEGMIDHWHKDSKFNLVGLCKSCHLKVHAVPATLCIRGYITTSNGVILDFENTKQPVVRIQPQPQPQPQYLPSVKADSTVAPDSTKYILECHLRKLTLKQIQTRLKTLCGVSMKMADIKTVITTAPHDITPICIS